MKYFERDGKYNFVDENNVVVGYSSEQNCCEHADFFIADSVQSEVPNIIPKHPEEDDFLSYRIDKDFFCDAIPYDDETSIVVFRLFDSKKVLPDKYLHLFNVHNGYYGHGFSVDIGGLNIRKGCI